MEISFDLCEYVCLRHLLSIKGEHKMASVVKEVESKISFVLFLCAQVSVAGNVGNSFKSKVWNIFTVFGDIRECLGEEIFIL